MRVSKRTVRLVAEIARDVVFPHNPPELTVLFPKTHRQILKRGFEKLMPDPVHGGIFLRFCEYWMEQDLDLHRVCRFVVHEMLHAKQMYVGRLKQKDGFTWYRGDKYVVRYNVNHRRHVTCKAGSYEPVYYTPWENEVSLSQDPIARIVEQKLKRRLRS